MATVGGSWFLKMEGRQLAAGGEEGRRRRLWAGLRKSGGKKGKKEMVVGRAEMEERKREEMEMKKEKEEKGKEDLSFEDF